MKYRRRLFVLFNTTNIQLFQLLTIVSNLQGAILTLFNICP